MGAVAVIAAIGLAIFLLRPTAPKETVVVLPSPDGHTGTVVVQRGDNRQVLDQPYATSRSSEDKVEQLSAADVKQEFGATLQALPARPRASRFTSSPAPMSSRRSQGRTCRTSLPR
jgi:hypothetical protein